MAVSKRAKITCIAIGTIVAAFPVGLLAVDALTPSIVRQALPASAANQANMPKSEMPRFAAKLGLSQRYDPKRDAKLPLKFSTSDIISWWQPPQSLDNAYYDYNPSNNSYSLAKYENGQVYFKAIAW